MDNPMRYFIILIALVCSSALSAQLPKVYDETIDPLTQIDQSVAKAKAEGKHVLCQVGGNWCPWCLRLADFVVKDSTINAQIQENYVYIHVNYPRRGAAKELLTRLDNPGRFGYPVLVVLDGEGRRLHTQDSSFLEEGQGYSAERVLRFLKGWTPQALESQ